MMTPCEHLDRASPDANHIGPSGFLSQDLLLAPSTTLSWVLDLKPLLIDSSGRAGDLTLPVLRKSFHKDSSKGGGVWEVEAVRTLSSESVKSHVLPKH